MLCQKCGSQILDDSQFCPECGARQEKESFTEQTNSTKKMRTKYCINCGGEILQDSIFCPECGMPQGSVSRTKERQSQIQPSKKKSFAGKRAANLSKENKIVAFVVGGVLVLCLIIGVLSIFIKPSINLNKYMKVKIEGYDTVGKASIVFDQEKFEKDYGKKINSTKKNETSSSDSYYDYTSSVIKVFWDNCVSGELDKTEGLSNGDVVKYTWTCNDEKALEYYGYKLKYKDMEYTVAGLKQAETFDPFEGITVVFEGRSPYGYAEVTNDSTYSEVQNVYFYPDKSNGLSNGDEVTVHIEAYYGDVVEYCIENYGKIPSALEKTFTVEGLNEYISSSDEISDDVLSDMQAKAKSVYDEYIERSWDESEKLEDFIYCGNYLLKNKEAQEWDYDNILYLVYKAQVRDVYSGNDGETYDAVTDVYWFISFYDLLVNDNGITSVDIDKYNVVTKNFKVDSGISYGYYGNKTWTYVGYPSMKELYESVIVSSADIYDCEDNIDQNIAPVIFEAENVTDEDGIIFQNSSEILLEESEITSLSDEELRYAINELYARKGYIFNDEELFAYYSQYDWYHPSVNSEDFTTDMFNEIEYTNIELLQAQRDSRN